MLAAYFRCKLFMEIMVFLLSNGPWLALPRPKGAKHGLLYVCGKVSQPPKFLHIWQVS